MRPGGPRAIDPRNPNKFYCSIFLTSDEKSREKKAKHSLDYAEYRLSKEFEREDADYRRWMKEKYGAEADGES